jgi:hypothetical protein
MKFINLSGPLAIAALLAACAQEEPVTTVAPQPVFDKFGGGSCEEGFVYVPGAVPEEAKCEPEDCVDYYDADGTLIECPPPGREPDGSDDSGRTPSVPGTPGRP